jgi:hypothetical protein
MNAATIRILDGLRGDILWEIEEMKRRSVERRAEHDRNEREWVLEAHQNGRKPSPKR